MNSRTFYNPETNQIKSVEHWSKWANPQSASNNGFIDLGYKKIAEAFTSVDPEERPILWKSLNEGSTYSFDLSMMNSKLRHKLRRLGIYQFSKKYLGEGAELLKKINNKKK